MAKLEIIRGLLAMFGPPKDTSPEATLSGDIDGFGEPEEQDRGGVIVEEATEDD